jgi:bacteriocin-like protein
MENKAVDQKERDVQEISENEMKEVSGGTRRASTNTSAARATHKRLVGEGKVDVPW